MAFQTNIFRDGEWVTQTVDLDAALRASASTTKLPAEAVFPSDRPPCGILSSTVTESPLVHKILPVRIRSKNHNDVAFIGDNLVTIRELRDNGQMYEILRYKSFDARIRNAIVLGDCPDESLDDTADHANDRIDEIDPLYHAPSSRSQEHDGHGLPPQLLVLVLSSGHIEFLFTAEVDGKLRLCNSTQESAASIPYHGHHLAVDPSFRYMAAAPFEDLLVIYELETLETLNERFIASGHFPKPFKSTRFRSLRGTIHDVQFLYPRPQDDYHIIVMVVMSSKSRVPDRASRRKYITWDWEAGDDLRPILAQPGHRQSLSKLDGVPLFSIPLKSQNAFFIVYEDHIAIVRQSLSSGEYDSNRVLEMPRPSPLHHGAKPPLWVSWARPFRRKEYSEKTDIIYLAREDGIVFHIEIDSMTLLYSGMELGCSGTNIGTAFTAAYDKFSDLFIIGGESSPGGIWKLAPRSELEQICTFTNWSPVTDMAVTRDQVESDETPGLIGPIQKPDKVFFASGRGATGCLIELRVGLKARIGVDIDIGDHVQQAWVFSNEKVASGALQAILALPHSTAVLSFSSDFSNVRAESGETTHFDTSSHTLHAREILPGLVVQCSEEAITLVTANQRSRHVLGDMTEAEGAVAEKAYCLGDKVAVAVQCPDGSRLHVLSIDQMDVSLETTWYMPGEVNCLSQFRYLNKQFVLVGSLSGEGPVLSVYSVDGELVVSRLIGPEIGEVADAAETLDAIVSLSVVCEAEEAVDIIGGTRFGNLLTIKISQDSTQPISCATERIGSSSVSVFPTFGQWDDEATAFASCDNTMFRLSEFSSRKQKYMRKDVVWATDASDISLPAPPIHSIFAMSQPTNSGSSKSLVLLLSGSNLYVADIEPNVGPVPRSITPGWSGTPTRVLYSDVWKCLVVALQTEGGISLALVDPDSGRLISKPLGKDRTEGELSSFGTKGDRVLGLHEWMYAKDGQTFPFIVVTTQSGKLLVVSVSQMKHPEESPPYRHLEHWTRYRRKGQGEPIYSVVADDQGLLYAAGNSVYWDILDLDEKKMKPVKKYLLESPAASLEIVNGRLYALTTMHSVEIIDYRSNPYSEEMAHLHSDRVSRAATHMITLEHTSDKSLWPVTLMSDVTGGIVGVWAPQDESKKELVTVFEGRLGNSIRRFVRGQFRARWQIEEQGHLRFGCLSSSTTGAEVLGASLDGTLRHFRLLGFDLWRFLSLVEMLTRKSMAGGGMEERWRGVDEGSLQQEVHPKNMHIQGDLLEHTLENRMLERLVQEAGCPTLFCLLLDGLEKGAYTSHFRKSGVAEEELLSRYFELGYDVLEYLLSPAI